MKVKGLNRPGHSKPRGRADRWRLGGVVILLAVFTLAAAPQAGPMPAAAHSASDRATAAACTPAPESSVPDRPMGLRGSFEDIGPGGALADWTIDTSLPNRVADVHGSSVRAVVGENSLRLANPAEASVLVRSRHLPALPAARYTVAAFVFNEAGPGRVYLEFWDDTDERIGVAFVTSTRVGAWQRVTLDAVSPAATVAVSVSLYRSVNTPGSSYFDDIRLFQAPATAAAVQANSPAGLYTAIDKSVFANLKNVTTVIHPALKSAQPIVVPSEPWESHNVYIYGTVLFDADECRYKMWYSTMRPQPLTLYAESSDGLAWEKPSLGLVAYDGDTRNNIVGDMVGPVSVIKDDREPDPARRYKMLATLPGTITQGVYFSPDGLRWTPTDENPVLLGGDVATAFFDEQRQQFVALTRMMVGEAPDTRRVVGVAYSDNFVEWTTERPVLTVRSEEVDLSRLGFSSADVYGMAAWPYGQGYIGFPWLFAYNRPDIPGPDEGVIDVRLAASANLEQWRRLGRLNVIPRGPDGSFDSAMVVTASQPLVVGNEMRLYYGGIDEPHGGDGQAAIGVATWRMAGLASLRPAGQGRGLVVTQPLLVTGTTLSVNAVVSGSLQVEILDLARKPLGAFTLENSDPFAGDATDHRMTWRGRSGLDALVGQSVRLRFHLDGADLYAFQFQTEP